MGQRTPLYRDHVACGAKIVDFAGWDMPLHYGSQLEEHRRVRQDAGLFDVSHMMITDVDGAGARSLLRRLLANDVDKLKKTGKALYTCLLNEQGGVIDDLIVYLMGDARYRVISNAGTRDKVSAWLQRQAAGHGARLRPWPDLAMIAAQGPTARTKVQAVLDEGARAVAAALNPFFGAELEGLFISRTGYTGEDGYELMVPADQASRWWNRLIEAGIAPCGLGARDTLRLEAGMNLYGTDMDERTTPLDAGLEWTVAWEPADRDFIGRRALEARRRAADLPHWIGLVMNDKGVLRNHQAVFDGERRIGEITSGSFSPTLGRAIAMARVATAVPARCQVEVRGRMVPVQIVKPPFVRHGKPCVAVPADGQA